MQQLKEGKTAREAAAQLYVQALPYKESELGDVMAERMEEVITEYERLNKDALENPDSWLERQVAQQCREETCAERCRVMIHMLAGITALNASMAGQNMRSDWLANTAFDEKKATPALEAELLTELKKAVENSTLGAVQLEALAEALKEESEEAVEDRILAFGKDAHDRKLLMSMIAYVNIKSGVIEAPVEATVEEIATAACLMDDTLCIVQDVQEGRLDEEVAPAWLQRIGSTAVCLLAGMGAGAMLGTYTIPLLMGTTAFTMSALPMALLGIQVTIAVLAGAEGLSDLGVLMTNGLWRFGKKTVRWIKGLSKKNREKKPQQAQDAAKNCEYVEDLWMQYHMPMEYAQHAQMIW